MQINFFKLNLPFKIGDYVEFNYENYGIRKGYVLGTFDDENILISDNKTYETAHLVQNWLIKPKDFIKILKYI